MKVLLLTDGIAPIVMGGMQKHSRLIAEYLSREGHDITLFHYSEKTVTEQKVRTYFSPKANENIELYHFIYKDNSRILGHYLRAQREMSGRYLEQYLKLNKSYDFIYAKGFMGWALLNQRSALGITVPIGVKFHGMNMFQKQPNFRGEIQKYIFRGSVRFIMNKSDVVFSYGGKITDVILSQGIERIKMIEIPSGIESHWQSNGISRTGVKRKFLFVGRYDRLKGLPELYKAILALNESRAWSLTIVGPIPENKRLKHENIVYAGALSNESELKEVYDNHDILINPSISEGMPNVILEAMSRGLAIIASDVGATSLLVSDQNGRLISPGSYQTILSAMKLLINVSNESLDALKTKSKQVIDQHYTWEKITPLLERSLMNLRID